MRASLPRLLAIVALSLTFAASTITIASAKGPGGGGGTPHGFSQGKKNWMEGRQSSARMEQRQKGWLGQEPPLATRMALTISSANHRLSSFISSGHCFLGKHGLVRLPAA